jgi:peroxin-5
VPLAGTLNYGVTNNPILSPDVKGKGKATARDHVMEYLAGIETTEAETDNDRYFEQENEEYIAHQQRYHRPNTLFNKEDNITGAWGALHDQWERFEPTATGIKQILHYPFQMNNPYLNSERTRQHSMHSHIDPLYDVRFVHHGFFGYR